MIPTSEAYRGAQLAYENSNELFKASALLAKNGMRGCAIALCVLSFEEAAKSISLVYRSEGMHDTKFLTEIFRDHRIKHELGTETSLFASGLILQAGFKIEGESVSIDVANLMDRIETWKNEANNAKKRGFYVDYINGNWCAPDQMSKFELETAVLACAITIATAKCFFLDTAAGKDAV